MDRAEFCCRKLTDFERLMFWDQSEDYPMVFNVRVRLNRILTLDGLRKAVLKALAVHPRLNSIIDPSGKTWQLQPDPRVEIKVVESFERHAKPLDLQKQCGLRVACFRSENGTNIQFDFHHASTDGIGALNFLNAVFTDHTVESVQTLSARDSVQAIPDRKASVVRRVVDFTRMMATAPRALANGQRGTIEEESLNAERLDRCTTSAYVKAAKDQSVTVNDLLVRDLMLTLSSWNRARRKSRLRPIRVLTPINVRSDKSDTTARNEIGYWFASRRPACWKPNPLLKSLNSEFNKVKQRGLNRSFERFLGLLLHAPGMNRNTFSKLGRICVTSAVLSNLGVIDQHLPVNSAGESVIDDITLAPPVRAHTWTAFLIYTRQGQLHLNLRHAPEGISGSDAKALLLNFKHRIQRTADPFRVVVPKIRAMANAI